METEQICIGKASPGNPHGNNVPTIHSTIAHNGMVSIDKTVEMETS